jgi:hypothetical protein
MTLRALCCCLLLFLAAGCGGAKTVTVTKTVTVETTTSGATKEGLGPPTETVLFGFLKSFTKKGASYELRFDPALFLGGVTANVAAAEDGAVEPGEPVPNDYFIVDEGHRLLTFRVPADAKLTVVALGPKNIPVTIEALAKMVAGDQAAPWLPIASGFWLRARIDKVLSLDQQYRP